MRRGSLNGFIVPSESRRTELREPGSREGSHRRQLGWAGHRDETQCSVALSIQRPTKGGSRLGLLRRTVCLNWARTDLWGSRWGTTDSTRTPLRRRAKQLRLKDGTPASILTNLASNRLFAKIAPHEIEHHHPHSPRRATAHATRGHTARAGQTFRGPTRGTLSNPRH